MAAIAVLGVIKDIPELAYFMYFFLTLSTMAVAGPVSSYPHQRHLREFRVTQQ